MKVLIISTIVPFIEGGQTFIVDWLDETLKKYGYKSEVIKIPFHPYYPEMIEQMLALRLFDISEYADLLIAIRTPSYIIKHPNKVLWFIHHHRGAYDLWGTPYQDIPPTKEGLQIREAIIQSDNIFLREAKKIYANSKVVADRLRKFNGIDSEVLYPPLLQAEKYCCKGYGDYIFYPSRITMVKRQYLAIEAMKHTKSDVKLVIAGNPDTKDELEYVESIVRKNDLSSKVELISRWVSLEEKIELFANALGCIYIPFDEDSYGYVSLEAYYSRKPVITCSDSGGALEVVENGINGFVTLPEPEVIAEAMDKLFYDKALAEKMGQSGYGKLISMNITWDNVIQKLIG
ncbi:MAG: glycosyltransferase family 4 protein [Nitrospirota bacterium]